MKNNKGITLIALIVTIIVLIILAGIAIAMLSGDNGVLKNADAARYDTAISSAAERISLAQSTISTSIKTNTMQVGRGYIATVETDYAELVETIVKELSAEKRTSGNSPFDEGYTVYTNLLNARTADNPSGNGEIVIVFTDGAFRSALPKVGESDAAKKGLVQGNTFISGSSKIYVEAYNPDEAILVYSIKVSNYGSELSKPVLTTMSNLKTAVTAVTTDPQKSALQVFEESNIGKAAWADDTTSTTPSTTP